MSEQAERRPLAPYPRHVHIAPSGYGYDRTLCGSIPGWAELVEHAENAAGKVECLNVGLAIRAYRVCPECLAASSTQPFVASVVLVHVAKEMANGFDVICGLETEEPRHLVGAREDMATVLETLNARHDGNRYVACEACMAAGAKT